MRRLLETFTAFLLKNPTFSHEGFFMVQISTHFIADLKRLADLKRKMDEMDELGKRLKS